MDAIPKLVLLMLGRPLITTSTLYVGIETDGSYTGFAKLKLSVGGGLV